LILSASILSASMLALLDMCEAINAGKTIDPVQSRRKVIGVDIEIRAHNRAAIETHPMASRIEMIEGSSIDPQIVARVVARTRDFDRVLVFLDSMHSHDHDRSIPEKLRFCSAMPCSGNIQSMAN
jgi:cephalosporin hydroxylase